VFCVLCFSFFLSFRMSGGKDKIVSYGAHDNDDDMSDQYDPSQDPFAQDIEDDLSEHEEIFQAEFLSDPNLPSPAISTIAATAANPSAGLTPAGVAADADGLGKDPRPSSNRFGSPSSSVVTSPSQSPSLMPQPAPLMSVPVPKLPLPASMGGMTPYQQAGAALYGSSYSSTGGGYYGPSASITPHYSSPSHAPLTMQPGSSPSFAINKLVRPPIPRLFFFLFSSSSFSSVLMQLRSSCSPAALRDLMTRRGTAIW